MKTRKMEKFVAGVSFLVVLISAFVLFGSVGSFAMDMMSTKETILISIICFVSGTIAMKVLNYTFHSMLRHEKHGYPKRRKRNRRVA